MLSQEVAPHVASVVSQAAVQQFPVPLTPQTPDEQSVFAVQAAPPASGATQAPPEQTNPLAQSVLWVQLVLQVMVSAQTKLPAQAVGVPATQVPLALQALAVSMLPLQLSLPQELPEG